MKEFNAILGFPLYCPPALSVTSSNLFTLYHQSLGLDDESATNILLRDEVDFVAQISYLQMIGLAINNALGHDTTNLCLLGACLVIGGTSNRGLVALLIVVEQMRCDGTSMPFVVVETILCLERLRHHPDQFFSGGPLLLQVASMTWKPANF